MIKLVVIALWIVSCGAEQTPVAEIKNYVGRGFQLVVTAGQSGGYCVLMEDAHNDRVELLTVDGALSKKQIGDAVGYLSYLEQIATGGLPIVTGIATGLAFTKKSRLTLPLLIVTVGAVGTSIGYRYLRGWIEGEGKEAIHAQALLGFLLPFGPLVEYLQRRSRVDRFIDKYKRIGHNTNNDRKNNNVIRRILESKPAYAGGCDAIAKQLRLSENADQK